MYIFKGLLFPSIDCLLLRLFLKTSRKTFVRMIKWTNLNFFPENLFLILVLLLIFIYFVLLLFYFLIPITLHTVGLRFVKGSQQNIFILLLLFVYLFSFVSLNFSTMSLVIIHSFIYSM